MQELLLQEKQVLVEELAAKNAQLERMRAELRAALVIIAEHKRVQRDLEIARQIQRQMLPEASPDFPGLILSATTLPSRGLGVTFTPCQLLRDRAVSRGDIHETGEIKRVVTSLLMQVDDLPSYTVVVSATNRPSCSIVSSRPKMTTRLGRTQPLIASAAGDWR